jgi:hypothetical protein
MRPVTVTVGPLAAASATNICASQSVSAGKTFILNGSLVTYSFQGTGSIAGNVLTTTAVTSGILQGFTPTPGTLLSGSGVSANTYVTIPQVYNVNTVGGFLVSFPQTVSSTTIYGGAVATLDKPRRILFTPTGNESSNSFYISGTDYNGTPITEVLTGANATAFYSAMDYATVTQIYPLNTTASTITVGTTTIAGTQWVRLDEYAPFPTAIQVTVSGTVNYTLQQTLQDPSSPFNIAPLLPYQVGWINSPDPAMVGATVSAQSSYTYAPLYARVVLNSGTGSLQAVFSQNASSSF